MARPLAAAALLLLIAAPTHAATLHRSPDPLPPGTPLTVTVALGGAVEAAYLNVCAADGHGNVTYCYPAQAMARGDGGNWTATTPRGFDAGQQLGVNVTATTAHGGKVGYPQGARYAFFFVEDAPDARAIPAAAALPLAAALVALAARRWWHA